MQVVSYVAVLIGKNTADPLLSWCLSFFLSEMEVFQEDEVVRLLQFLILWILDPFYSRTTSR